MNLSKIISKLEGFFNRRTALRILLFAMAAALLLYLPFYHFAYLYLPLYEHVNLDLVNWWFRWTFSQHNGIQIYVAYVLMYLAIGLTVIFDYLYSKLPLHLRGAALAVLAVSSLYYLWTIGFCPPTADANLNAHFNAQDIGCTFAVVVIAFSCGHFFDKKVVRWLLAVLLGIICLVPVKWSNLPIDYYYFFTPALRTINGHALNQSYFQYDHLMAFLSMGWMKLRLEMDRFYVIVEFLYLAFFIGIYIVARKFFFNKQFIFYFIFTVVLTKTYMNFADIAQFPQIAPLRLDMWLVLFALVFWKGAQHWSLGLALGFFLIFHHAFGMIYSIAYICLIAALSFQDLSKIKQFVPNICLMAGGMLINHFFISSGKSIAALNYVKYNIGFMPIDPKSLFWYVPALLSAAFLLLWKSRRQLPGQYFQAGLFLVFLSVGNLLYFFGRSHDANLINIAAGLWLVLFMLMDIIIQQLPQSTIGRAQKVFIPLAGLLIVGLIAYFYSDQIIERVGKQIVNLPKISELFAPDQGVGVDLQMVKTVTGGSANVIFVSTLHDLAYYYQGGYTPPDFCPFESQIFMRDVMDRLNSKIVQGYYLIVPQKEFNPLIETILLMRAKYMYRISDFVYISNNQPAS